MIELFPDQQEALDKVMQRYKEMPVGGRALVVAPTAWGKTVFFSALIHSLKLDKPVLIIAHRDELLDQARDKFRMFDPTAIIGKVGGGLHEYGAPITVASVDTISGQKHLEKLPEYGYGLVIIDECFVAGTLIDGKPIEQIKEGDIVIAFDDKTNTFAQKKVVRTFKRPVGSHLYKIVCGENTVVCTPNHPFYTSSGWKRAEELSREDTILYAGSCQNPNSSEMHNVRKAIHDHNKNQKGSVQKDRKSLLLQGMQWGISNQYIIQSHGRNQQEVCIRSDEKKEPDAYRRISDQNANYLKSHRAQTIRARGEWETRPYSTATISQCPWMGNGAYRSNQNKKKQQSPTVAIALQDRHSQSRSNDSNRNRREFTHAFSQERTRQEEGYISTWQRVDSIEIYEPGSDGTFGGLCSDGYVYNFEVEDYHTYTANGFVVHNCHHAPAPKYMKVINILKDSCFLLGVTATDERLDGKSLEPIFGEAVFRMPIVEAIAKKRLSDVKAIAIRTEVNLDNVKSQKNMEGEIDFNQTELDLAVNTSSRNRRIVEAYQEHCIGERAICFCVSIAHAFAIADAFNEAGIKAVCVHGNTNVQPIEERKQIYADFDKGEIKVLTNVLVLTEGFDAPKIKAVLMARPTQSRALYLQCVGRGLRKSPGKTHCIILDLTDNCNKYRLKPQSLKRAIKDTKEGETILESLEREKKENEERQVQVHKLKEKRVQDIHVDLFEKLEWKELPSGAFLLEVGPEKHKIALTPSKNNPELYYVQFKRAPFNSLNDKASLLSEGGPVPIDWAQQLAEKKAKEIMDNPSAASWMDKVHAHPKRNDPITEPQKGMLRMYRIPYTDDMTKGEASDLISAHKQEIERRKAAKALKKAAMDARNVQHSLEI